jgi:hypothetical protein
MTNARYGGACGAEPPPGAAPCLLARVGALMRLKFKRLPTYHHDRETNQRARSAMKNYREGETGVGLQPADERLSHRRGRSPESSADRIARDVTHQTDAALGNHLGRRTVAGVLVTLD